MQRSLVRTLHHAAPTSTRLPFLRAMAASAGSTSSSTASTASHGHLGKRGHMHHRARKGAQARPQADNDYDELAREAGGTDEGGNPDELVMGDVREQLAGNVQLDEDREIGMEGGAGRLQAEQDSEQGALERRGYGGDEAPYITSPGANDLDDRSEQVDIGRSA